MSVFPTKSVGMASKKGFCGNDADQTGLDPANYMAFQALR
jgi:hypothetical protein